jgi:hypothetical protein
VNVLCRHLAEARAVEAAPAGPAAERLLQWDLLLVQPASADHRSARKANLVVFSGPPLHQVHLLFEISKV